MTLPHELELVLLAAVLILGLWSTVSVMTALLYAGARRHLLAIAPPARRRVLLLLGALPLGVAAVTTALVLSPDVPLTAGHCHPTLGCAAHSPAQLASSHDDWMLGIAVAATMTLLLWRLAAVCLGHRHYGAILRALPRQQDRRGFWIVDSPQPLALTAGLWRGQIHLSNGLLQALDDATLQVVLDHEAAHACHRDNLAQLLISLLYCPLSAVPARRVLGDLRECAEQLADRAAADHLGAERVARALVRTHRLAMHTPAPGYASFGPSSLERRIAALYAAYPEPAVARRSSMTLIVTALAASVVAVNAAHHLLEDILIWIG
jgi:Zn-dependent protease with chaperone function